MAGLVTSERKGAVSILTIDRPEKKNALSLEVVQALAAAFDDEAGREDLGCVVLRGAGDGFAAGADIAQLRERRAAESLQGINSGLFRKIEDFPVPVIAAVHGWALGGGMELAMACDIRIAADTARFGQPELRLGILPAAGGMHRLPALVGMGMAKDLVLTGRILDAQQALAAGLVSRVVPEADLLDEALSTAEIVAGMAPMATRLAKGVMNALFRVRPDTAFMMETAAQAVLFDSDEKMRRMTDFLEKKTRKEERR